jgi:hypothetical protein
MYCPCVENHGPTAPLQWRSRPRWRITRATFSRIRSRQIGYAVLINGRSAAPWGSPRALGSPSLDLKQEHKKDLRLRRITHCEAALADAKSSRAAAACTKCLAVAQESTYSVLKQILPMRVALNLPARRMVVADSFSLAQASVGRIWPHGLASRARTGGRGVCIRARDESSAVCVAIVLRVRKQSCGERSR